MGQLQSNKARRAARLFDVIQSVDSADLARRLDVLAGEPDLDASDARAVPVPARLAVYLQVNIDRDPRKSGFDPGQLERDLADLSVLDHLELRGLMTVGRLASAPEDARPTFAALRRLSEHLRRREPRLGPDLSMGMSDDFEVAVEEGATVVRVGRAIFGDRPSG